MHAAWWVLIAILCLIPMSIGFMLLLSAAGTKADRDFGRDSEAKPNNNLVEMESREDAELKV